MHGAEHYSLKCTNQECSSLWTFRMRGRVLIKFQSTFFGKNIMNALLTMHGDREHLEHRVITCQGSVMTLGDQCSQCLPLPHGSRRALHPEEDVGSRAVGGGGSDPFVPVEAHATEKMRWESACSTWSSQSRGAGLGGSGGRELREGSFCHTQQGNSAWEKQAYHTVCSQCCKRAPEAWWHKRKRCSVSTHPERRPPAASSRGRRRTPQNATAS